jgi:hypothetical protein
MGYQTNQENPAASSFQSRASTVIEAQERRVELVTTAGIKSDRDAFHVVFTRQIYEDGELIRERTWEESIPRQFQ